jgi:hypothetical protein
MRRRSEEPTAMLNATAEAATTTMPAVVSDGRIDGGQ